MAPQFFEVHVWAGRRRLTGETMRVVIDWHPTSAEHVRAQLNNLIRRVAHDNRAVAPDLGEYALRAFAVDVDGRRVGHDPDRDDPVWTWRYLPTVDDAGGVR